MSTLRALRFCLVLALIVFPASAYAFVAESNQLVRDGGDFGGGGQGGGSGGNQGAGDSNQGTTPVNGAGNGVIGALVPNVRSLGREVIQQVGNTLRDIVPDKSGRLDVDDMDVLVNQFDQCRWLDNTGDFDYFVPFASDEEWRHFRENSPNVITKADCCMPAEVRLTAGDGQFFTYVLPIGRNGSNGANGRISLAHAFNVTRALDSVSWVQTVSDVFMCRDGNWVSTNPLQGGEEPPVDPVDPFEPAACGADHSQTGSFSGTNEGVDTDYTYPMGMQQYAGTIPVAATKMRVYYSNANTMSVDYDGARHNLVNIKREGTTLSGEFRSAGLNLVTWVENMGQAVRRVSWKVLVCQPGEPELPQVDVDELVFAKNCRYAGTASNRDAAFCISNGNGCVSNALTAGAGTINGVLNFVPGTHDGAFCSSVSATDSATDGARVVFDLSARLAGVTGDAQVVIPFGAWMGVRDTATARHVMQNPQMYMGVPARPSYPQQNTAIVFTIPNVAANARLFQPTVGLNSGQCGKDCNNNYGYDIEYFAATKELHVLIQKGSRWKKESYEPLCTQPGNWTQQYRYGRCNGKVWSEVRVVSPAPAQCGSAVSTQQNPFGGIMGTLCNGGAAGPVTETRHEGGMDLSGEYSWTCTGSAGDVVNCSASYNFTFDPGYNPYL